MAVKVLHTSLLNITFFAFKVLPLGSYAPMPALTCKRYVQKLSGLTTVHEVDKAYGGLTLIVFNIVPFRSYTLRPTFLPLLETFCELLFQDV